MKDSEIKEPNRNSVDNPIIIQDIIAVASFVGKKNPVGEFDTENVDELTQLDRMLKHIDELAQYALKEHRKQNCDDEGNIKPDNVNSITRLVTNEFMLYTAKPLSMKEFEFLQNRIMEFAKQYPENLHLVLSSFAVKTPDDKIMNVVAHIECGPNAKLNLIVKNNPSRIDPTYSESIDGRRVTYENVDITKGHRIDYPIQINSEPHTFSFNNTLICTTAGKAKMHVCVDVCYDHNQEVAKSNLTTKLTNKVASAKKGKEKELLPSQCSHIVTSNCTNTKRDAICIDPQTPINDYTQAFRKEITHADPKISHIEHKADTCVPLNDQVFGTPIKIYITQPRECKKLAQNELDLVNKHNQSVQQSNIPKQRLLLPSVTTFMMNQSKRSEKEKKVTEETQKKGKVNKPK